MSKKALGLLSLAVCAGLLISSGRAFAVGTTGCGLGSEIFERNSFVSQSLAATTNTTGIVFSLTTGTSNCKVDGVLMTEQEKVYYVESNFKKLEEEMAKGEGENLAGLARLFNCQDALVPQVGQMTRNHYDDIFSSTQVTPYDVYKSVEGQIRQSPSLAKGCPATS
jgi:hypothetical protein